MLNRDNIVELSKADSDIKEHLLTLYDLVLEINAKVVVELGAGLSTYALTAAVNATDGKFWSIDIVPGGRNGVLKRDLSNGEQELRCHPMTGDSLDVGKHWDEEIDFLFIDTSHTYEQTKGELNIWPKLVRKGGIIAMHDTTGAPGPNQGCRLALDEYLIKHLGEYKFTHYPNCNGLSVLRKK